MLYQTQLRAKGKKKPSIVVLLVGHAKELIIKNKLICIKHFSPSYFGGSTLDYLLYFVVRCHWQHSNIREWLEKELW